MGKNIYNVGSEEMNYSKEDICERIKKYTGVYVHYADIGEDEDKRNYVVSYEKIKNMGFNTTISVETGIKELVNALRAVEYRTPYANV